MEIREYSFEKLLVWQKAKDLAKTIYQVTKDFPSDERFGFTSQMRRSSVSVPANLAEGSGRKTKKDKAHYSTQAYSSLMELLNHTIITYELEFISKDQYHEVRKQIQEVGHLLSRLRNAQLEQN